MKFNIHLKKENKKGFKMLFNSLGVAFLLLGSVSVINDLASGWSFIIGSLVYFLLAFFNFSNTLYKVNQYKIKRNLLFGKSIKLKEVTSVKKFAGDLIFISADYEFRINTQEIDTTSLQNLEQLIHQLSIPVVSPEIR